MRDIVINCRKVYEVGSLYKNKSDEINIIENNLKKISDNIKSAWSGADSHNFIESFEAHIYELENLKNYLEGNSKLLKNNALEHNQSNNKYASRLERRNYNG